jgi:hypothetical protein
MTVQIFLDLDRLHLIVAGQWHRASLRQVPRSGERVAMLCGLVDEVEYGAKQDSPVAPGTCWHCDLAYRQREGIAYLAVHPGLLTAPSPRRDRS